MFGDATNTSNNLIRTQGPILLYIDDVHFKKYL